MCMMLAAIEIQTWRSVAPLSPSGLYGLYFHIIRACMCAAFRVASLDHFWTYLLNKCVYKSFNNCFKLANLLCASFVPVKLGGKRRHYRSNLAHDTCPLHNFPPSLKRRDQKKKGSEGRTHFSSTNIIASFRAPQHRINQQIYIFLQIFSFRQIFDRLRPKCVPGIAITVYPELWARNMLHPGFKAKEKRGYPGII